MLLFRLYICFVPDGKFRALMLLFLFVGVVLLILVSQMFRWVGAVQPGGVVLCIILFNTPVETYVVGEDKRQRMYGFVRRLVGEGRQVYIICPAVEQEEDQQHDRDPAAELKSVKEYARQLREEVFPQLRVELLHGRMKPREKEQVMAAFSAGQIDVLVSTTVIEVGVDVPNAALMVVENAERFGLSQLHQLRGRVGRGAHRSYCILITSSRGETARQRLRTLAGTTDGFRISEEDLKLRGPGDFFGSRQHGLPTLHVADLSGDMRTLSQAQQAAQQLLRQDPELLAPRHRPVWEQVREMFRETADIFN
jgi:ATP-dependent DNA helicase RecG